MGFKDFIFAHFPHRWLNIKKKGTEKLFSGLGNIFDYISKYIELLQRNNTTRSAIEILPDLENEYGIPINPSTDIDVRRSKIIIKKRQMDCPITKENMLAMLQLLGYEPSIQNLHNQSVMLVRLSNTGNGKGDLFGAIELLHENVRAHIAFKITFTTVFVGMDIILDADFSSRFSSITIQEEKVRKRELGTNAIAIKTGYSSHFSQISIQDEKKIKSAYDSALYLNAYFEEYSFLEIEPS